MPAGTAGAGAVSPGAVGRSVVSAMVLLLVRRPWSVIAPAEVGGDVAEHGAPGGVAGGEAAGADLARGVEIDLVLEDLLDDDGHLVPAAHIDQRPGAGVEHDHALLDQGGQLEAPAHLVD